jgi:GWxTD domain-containing protein
MSRNLIVYLPLLALFVISCGSSRNLNIERGTGYNFQAGHPEFRTSAFGFIDEDNGPTLLITAEVVKGSLVYKSEKDSDSLKARFSLEYQVQDLNSSQIVASKNVEESVTSVDQNIASTREALNMDYSLQVKPSRFRITVNITDLNSDKNITQTAETYIPETETGAYTLSKVQMYGKTLGDDEWDPINTYDVKGRIDSLRFVVQVISEQTDQPMQINTRLIRFASDTGYTRPMHFSNYSPSSIEYKGIDYDRDTEIQTNQRTLTSYGNTFIEYKFAKQDRGNYRFEVTATKEKGEPIYKARAFGVKSENYPAISTARELARPLIYLMGEGDHEELMAINDSDSLKREIDRFWLKNVGNTHRARNVIQMYYQRVEEANKQFSNFKEGWKTDLGMIYILFGAPWYTEDHLKELIWYFSYNHDDPEYSYRFYQPKLKNKYYPFYHYLLQRQNYYYTIQYLQRELWLTGQILTRQI